MGSTAVSLQSRAGPIAIAEAAAVDHATRSCGSAHRRARAEHHGHRAERAPS